MLSDQKHQLGIWRPAGIVLAGIGLLTLSTPLFASLAVNALLIDLVAGGALLLAGALGIFVGRRQKAK
jgi:hypothetical protein